MSENDKQDDAAISRLFGGDETGYSASGDKLSQVIDALETQNQFLSDKMLEERFLWILCIFVLFDVVIFTHMEGWSGPIVIGVIELIIIVILADKCGVNTVAPLIDKLTGAFNRNS